MMDDAPKLSAQEGVSKKSPFDELSREDLIHKCKGLLVIAQKAKQAKTELQIELDSYKNKVKELENIKKNNLENLNTLQELVDSLTEQKLNFITEVDSAQSKVKELSKKCHSYEEEIKAYNVDSIARDNKICDISQKLSDLDSELISLRRQNTRLLEENEQLISQLTEIEAKTVEVNNIGLMQQEQLKLLEENVQKDAESCKRTEELELIIVKLETQLKSYSQMKETADYENKIQEMTQMYETEKTKKEKLNIKLKSYKDKILKCAACINQLKNSRFILAKTVKEYSENIPKWQDDIIKASKELDSQINYLNTENVMLKDKLKQLESHLLLSNKTSDILSNVTSQNEITTSDLVNLKDEFDKILLQNKNLNTELLEIQSKYQRLVDSELPTHLNENKSLKNEINELTQSLSNLKCKNTEMEKKMSDLENEKHDLSQLVQSKTTNNSCDMLLLQVKALESEKDILVKEKLNAKDSIIESENKNKILRDKVSNLMSENESLRLQLQTLSQQKLQFEKNHIVENETKVNLLKCDLMAIQEQYDRLKKEYDDLQDLNSLLREEVDTLKLSLEQPSDDTENLSDINASLQADLVKLETKLSSYKQENSSLLVELKESRFKIKEYDSLFAEFEEAKSKLQSYKTENAELLNEMKEINQVLKERGESISKLQKAIAEMERLIESLEKDNEITSQENSEFRKKIELLENEIRTAEKTSTKTNNFTDTLTAERDNAIKLLEDKDVVITSLKDEIEKLKQQSLNSSEIQNDDNISTSTISKADETARMRDLDETFEEKYTKLRLFALKLKKKLTDTGIQLQKTEEDKIRLEKLLNDTSGENNKNTAVKSENSTAEVAQLQEKVKTLTSAIHTAEQNTTELQKIKAELNAKNQQLSLEIEAHKETKENLEKAKRDIKKKNVLSLEMEDYERSMKDLTAKMEENKKKMIQMESTIDTHEGTINSTKTQIKLLEEQIKTEETQNRLLKEELQQATENTKEKDDVIQLKNDVIRNLEQNLEDEKRKNEESNLETTLLLSEKERIIIGLGEEKAELSNKVKKLEFKCAELNENVKLLNIELADLKTEYTSYKVRAQAVLRQNQTVDHSQEEQLKEETAALKVQIETLSAKLKTVEEECEMQTNECENARRRAAEASNEVNRAQQRTARLQGDLARLGHQLESERTQHKLQVSTLIQCYKTQITELEARLRNETENLKNQVLLAQESAKVGRSTVSAVESPSQYMIPVIPKDDGSDGDLEINVSMIPREEGEGSESAPSPPPSKPFTSGGSGRSPVPLERLLEEGVPEDDALDTNSLGFTPEQEVADLKRRLQAQQHRVKHVTVLLSESERECARMAQLSELLKAELRRVRGTTQNAHNTEYMKNVTLKFLTLPSGDERIRLVPVLQKILTLTPDETQKIQAIAKGLDPNSNKGWGSYLPWPGGK